MRMVLKALLRVCLLLLLVSAVVGMVATYSSTGSVPRDFARSQRVLDFLDSVAPGWDPIHLVSFALLGFVAHFAWRKGRPWQAAIDILVVATFVEILQIWIPGHEAAVSHAVLNIVSGVSGFGLGWLCTYAWSTESLPGEYQQSTH